MISEAKKIKKNTYWNNYYSQGLAPTDPSNFARIALEYMKKDENILELGCGNARDSIYFASKGFDVTAIDQSATVIKNNSEKGIPNITFLNGDFTNIKEGVIEDKINHVYSRFTLHSVKKDGYLRTLDWCKGVLPSGGKLCIEARTINDPIYGVGEACPDDGYINTHYRRFLTMQDTLNDLIGRDFKLLYAVENYIDSWYKDDHAVVLRIIAEKK